MPQCKKVLLNLHVGQCGVQNAANMWADLQSEHFGENGYRDPNSYGTYFCETTSGAQQPRCILLDTDPGTVDNIISAFPRGHFNSQQMLVGNEDSASCYARGYNKNFREMEDRVFNCINRTMEKFDFTNGFFVHHSIGGGTGSGFLIHLMEGLCDNYAKVDKTNFTNVPSPTFAQIVEPINACLAISCLKQLSGICYFVDNQSLYNICTDIFRKNSPNFRHLNDISAHLKNNIFNSLVEGLTSDMANTNLVPFPEACFMTSAIVPLALKGQERAPQDIWNLLFEGYTSNHELITVDLTRGKYISSVLMFRGSIDHKEVYCALNELRKQNSFVNWMPTGFKTTSSRLPYVPNKRSMLKNLPMSVTKISNHTSMGHYIEQLQEHYNMMLSHRAFSHWYLAEGMQEEAFFAANLALSDLIDLYDDMFSYQTMAEVVKLRGLDFSKIHTLEERDVARGIHASKGKKSSPKKDKTASTEEKKE